MGWISSFSATLIAVLALVGTSAAATPPRVTVIGDSVLTAVEWNATPLAIFEDGLDLQLDIGVCRTLEGVSCPFEGRTVPTLLDVVASLGPDLGETVLIEAGYNDPAAEFPQRVEDAVEALLAAGVKRILWVNMREWQQQYIGMNRTLVAAAARHPQLTIIDWERASHDHYSWFQGDGIHLVYDGAVAMATLLNASLKEAVAAPLAISTQALPVAYVELPYIARLEATGGNGPYSWRITSGPLPRGLHLLADGRITGEPRRSGRFAIVLQATDRYGKRVVQRETLLIKP